MNKKTTLAVLATAVAILTAGCTKETPEQVVTPAKEIKTVLSADLRPLTKTAIDGVKVSWTKNDAISVNGSTSEPLQADAEKADFSFTDVLTAPYSAVYPASIGKDATTVTLPAQWDGTSAPTPLAAYAASGTSLGFAPVTSLLKLQVTGAGQTLKQISVTALGGEPVSGDFTIDFSTLSLTPAAGNTASTVTVLSGAALGTEPQTLYVPIPAGQYTQGLQVDFEAEGGSTMRRTLSARTLTAGTLRSLPALDFGGAKGIMSAADFAAFAAAVNAGESTEPWENSEGVVNLLADIDFTGITDWTPVGNATAPWTSYNPQVTAGHPFLGKFDGNAHHIKNLHLVCNETTAGKHFGLFGYVGPGALVQNFVIEDNCSLTVSTNVSLSAGMIAGVVYDAQVRDITSYAPMTYNGGATGLLHMALIGGVYAKDQGVTVDSVHNRGAITCVNTKNMAAGITGIHIAGIVGFANAPTNGTKRIVISDSNNYGDMTSQAGRTSGIVAAANSCTDITGCENHGDQMNTMASKGAGRLGNITCITANGSTMTRCKNYGDLISTTEARVGGLISLPNAPGVTYSMCENYGEILSDSQYRGVFFGYINQDCTWSNCHASGKVGKYNNGTPEYDLYSEATKINYLGPNTANAGTYTNITYDIITGEKPVANLDVDADFRMFFIGNSFTKDAVEHLPGILAAAGLNKVQMVHMYYGGRTIPEYNNGWSTVSDYKCYLCNPGQTSWTELSGYTLSQIAASQKYDIVTVQEHTGRLLAWGWTNDEETAVQGIVAKIKEAQTSIGGNPKLYYILSQAYYDLSKAQNVTKPFTDQAGMWTVISAQAKTAVETCGFDGVISTGAMLQNLRTSGLNNSMDLTRDGYHMDYGIARYGASCTVFETVIGPFNGNLKLDSNTYRFTMSSTADGSYSTPVTDANAPVALQAARYAIANPYAVTDMAGMGGGSGTPDDPAETKKISISNAEELVAFATSVNNNDKEAISAEVTLTADIDCSSIASWTPIGNCTMSTWEHSKLSTIGPLFTGSFDGQNHSIKNLHLSFEPTVANGAWGFFGGIGDGAVIKDLTFDSSCSLNISTSKSGAFGMLAGLVTGATVENVKSYAAITGGGTSSLAHNTAAGRVTAGGLIGNVQPSSKVATLTGLRNAGTVGSESAPFSSGSNLSGGVNGFHFGGIAGFASNTNNTTTVTFTNCVNDAAIYSTAGRTSGIVAAANRYTILKDCENNGDVHHSGTSTFRLGNITCIAAVGCVFDGCINRGDLVSISSSSVAGIVCLISDDSVQMKNCKSIGADIVSASIKLGTNQTYNGVLYGQCAKNNATFYKCYVSGRVGKYSASGTEYDALTASNYFQYAGQANDSNSTMTTENILFYSE